MPKKVKSVEVMEASDALWASLHGLGKAVSDALADGWQPGADVPAIGLAAVQHLGGVMKQLSLLDDDFKESVMCSAKTHALGGLEMAELLLKKDAPAPV